MNDSSQNSVVNENIPIYSVNEISNSVKRLIESQYSNVYVKGEIGRVAKPYSGHIYLDLKDENSVLSAVIWKGNIGKLSVEPEEGLEVKALGKLSTFHGQSKYQLIIEKLIPSGTGSLMALMEKRKEKYKNLGYFDSKIKKKLPFLPKVIGVITSLSGVVIKDILHRLHDRYPSEIIIWPVSVQGKNCPKDVSNAIIGFNSINSTHSVSKPDVIIVARGGGSVEDLWGFNEEEVIETVYKSRIPIISAIGHETDVTLIDFVSDLRVPTPSAAAEIVVPVRKDLYKQLSKINSLLNNSFFYLLELKKNKLMKISSIFPSFHEIFLKRNQHLDNLIYKFANSLNIYINKKKLKYASLRLERMNLEFFLEKNLNRRKEIANLSKRLDIIIKSILDINRKSFLDLCRIHDNLSYKNTLSRGYVVVRDNQRKTIKKRNEVEEESILNLEFFDGTLKVKSFKN